MTPLARVLTELAGDRQQVRLLYGTATGTNTVRVMGADTPVVLPAVVPVTTGQWCAVLEAGGDRLILGPVTTP